MEAIIGIADHLHQFLDGANFTNRNDKTPADLELAPQYLRNIRPSRGDEYGVKRSGVSPPQSPIAVPHLDVGVFQLVQRPPRAICEIAMPLDAEYFAGQSAQNRRRVTRSGANIEDAVAGLDLGGLDHQRDNVWLRNSLTGGDGERSVFVGKFLHSCTNESLARHLPHRFEHALVSDTPSNYLKGYHAVAIDRAILDWGGHFCHKMRTFGDG